MFKCLKNTRPAQEPGVFQPCCQVWLSSCVEPDIGQKYETGVKNQGFFIKLF